MSEEVRSGIREDFMKSKCRPKLVETNDPSVRLRPRPDDDDAFYLFFQKQK
jgi:hypothetical protein